MTLGYKKQKILKGIAASPGIAIGRAYHMERKKMKIVHQYLIDISQIPTEMERFKEAVANSEEQLLKIKKQMPDEIKSHSYIIDGQLLILKDKMIFNRTLKTIEEEQINAEWALKKSVNNVKQVFEKIDDEYIRSRISDIEYATERVLWNLAGKRFQSIADINEPVIVVAHDLTPADATQMEVSKVMGFITEIGGRTSHTAIMARSLEIPAVVGVESATQDLTNGNMVIIDGEAGLVILDPDDETLTDYYTKQGEYRVYRDQALKYSYLPAETVDHTRIKIYANIEFIDEAASVLNHGAEGIGLYRTEFLYLNRKERPSEELLFTNYRDVVKIMHPHPVTIRTLDMGCDKFTTSEMVQEINPALGLRSIRLCLRHEDVFKTQLRAILRASAYGNVRIMFPMISGLSELMEVKNILRKIQEELESEDIPFDKGLKIGAMIEVPSAVVLADVLAKEVDFFSIGTNDLIQYTLAIDRVNEHVAHMYEPLHPAILRMVKRVVEAGHGAGIEVAMCGEMAGEPAYVPILLGLGLDELSMNAFCIPKVKRMMRSTSVKESKEFLDKLLSLTEVSQIKEFVRYEVSRRFPEDFPSKDNVLPD
ncbi:MAG TPA: phosphoenolpyruvate--protein phosphotransferase [Syntrophaceae bacterium]|nr:phosphoenolpyruvate--protein phosphotransferase [Syntrophaceae bacterium]